MKLTRYQKFLNILIGFTGSFILIAYISYAYQFAIRNGQLRGLFLPLAVIFMVLIPILFHKLWKKLLRKSYGFFKNLFAYGMTFYVVTFFFMCGFLAVKANTQITPQTMPENSAVLVFGCKINGMSPSKTLRARLDTVYSLLSADASAVCIVSGGQGADEVTAEAIVMRDYLVAKGISESRIFLDEEATDTVGNFSGFLRILNEQGLSDRKLIAVSSDFHIARIEMLARRSNVSVLCCSSRSVDVWQLWTSLVREYMSYVKLLLNV